MSSNEREGIAGRFDRSTDGTFQWSRGIVAGFGAFVVGYLATVAVIFVAGNHSGNLGSVLNSIGLVFYNAQVVPAHLNGHATNFLLSTQNPNVPIPVYFLIPVVVVGGAGALVVRAGRPTATTVLNTGSALAVGYVVPMVLGALLISVSFPSGHVATLDLSKAVVFGLAYPVVFGTLGAAVSVVLQGALA